MLTNPKPNKFGWLTLSSYEGVCLGEFNMDSPRVRSYVITRLIPAFIRRKVWFVATWNESPQFSYPYHYGFAGDVFDSIHVSKDLSRMRIIENYEGLVYIEPKHVLQ